MIYQYQLPHTKRFNATGLIKSLSDYKIELPNQTIAGLCHCLTVLAEQVFIFSPDSEIELTFDVDDGHNATISVTTDILSTAAPQKFCSAISIANKIDVYQDEDNDINMILYLQF